MPNDLSKSLAELDELLKNMSDEALIEPHLTHTEAPVEEDHSPYCIKNGAYVRVSEDNMSAWIYLNPPKDGEEFYSRSLIVEFLGQNKVIKGLEDSNISAIAKKHVYEREILVASGKPPVEGQNGYYEYCFNTADRRQPTLREDGTVDYASMSELSNVHKGDVIAIYHHAVQSEDGFDVLGRDIMAKVSRELPPLHGRGVSSGNTPDIYIADMDGKIDFRDGHIDIKDTHEISGDVDLITGKVEFFGDIHITGNVEMGVVIRAGRNVVVDGVVEAVTIFAGGDVVLARGIQGGQKARIVAKGNVSAEFIEHSTVEAGGDIRANSFINSNIYAGGRVTAEGKHGLILGGNVRGLLGVSAMNMGNVSETKTIIASGYSAEDYVHYLEAFRNETEVQKKLSETVERMTQILREKRLGNNKINAISDKELLHLNEKKDEYFETLDETRKEKDMLVEVIEKGKGSTIVANGNIYRGVTICVEGTPMPVTNNTCYMKYKNEGGKIISSVLVLN